MATKKYVCNICGYKHEGDKAPDVCPLCKATSDNFSEETVASPASKKKGLNTNSDIYAVVYAAVVVVIVAFLLAAVSSALGERQQQNIRLDKMKQILSSLNIKNVDDAAAEYAKIVKSDPIIDVTGAAVKPEGGFDVKNDEITPDNLPLYVCELENGETKYVIPMLGQGLWGGIWGYMAVNSDGNTIYGTYFSHSSETPGLGAEIASEKFTSLFGGKQLYDGGDVALVVKKAADASSASEVNAISGATITCTGVNAMLKKYLENYKAFLTQKEEADVEPAPATEATDAAVTEANVTE